MDIKIINQALKFENSSPNFSEIKELYSLAAQYQQENNCFFLDAKRGQKSSLKDEKLFFEFLNTTQKINTHTFYELKILKSPQSRAQNIEFSSNSKNRYLKVFDNVLTFKGPNHPIQLLQEDDLVKLDKIEHFIAIENAETFLKIHNYLAHFKNSNFIYLGGYSNRLTRKFLASKNVEFFLDFDIEGMNIYESFECKSKSLHIPKSLDTFFKNRNFANVDLYKKQISRLKKSYSPESTIVIKLIKAFNAVVEQEIIYETY